ncbi:MAG: hypothetical protein AB7N71_04770, partial [Phycisphaerae bacterium]
IDTKALIDDSGSTLPPVPKDVLALQAPNQRKNMWQLNKTGTSEGVGLVPVILQPEGDQPIDARLAKGVIEHDRLWSPTWIPNESQNGQNAPQTANLAPVDQDEIFDNAFDNQPAYTAEDGQVVYDMQPINQASSLPANGWDEADWNFNPTYESDVERVAAARSDFQDDVTVRLGEYGDPGYYDGTTIVDGGYATQPTTVVYNEIEYDYDYPSFGYYPYFSTFGTWGVPYPCYSPYAYYPAYNYYYPGFSFGFSYFNDPRYYGFRRYGRLGSFYRGFWDARYGYGYGGYSNAYRVGSRFGRFLSGGYYGRGSGVRYLGRGYRARSAARFSARDGFSSRRGRSAATYGYRPGSRDGRRSGATNFLQRSNSGSRFGGLNQPRGVRETNRGSRIGSRDGRTRVGSENRGRIQQMDPINRGTRGSSSGIRERSANPRGSASGIRQRSSDPRGSNSGLQRRSGSNSGQMRGIRESNRGTRQRSNIGGDTRRIAPQQRSNSGIRSRQSAPSGRSNIRGTRGSGNEMRATPRSSSGFRSGSSSLNRSAPTQRTITGARSGRAFGDSRSYNRAAPRASAPRSNFSSRSAAPSPRSFGRSSAPRSAPRMQSSNRGFRSGSSFNRGSSRSAPRSMSSGRSGGFRSSGSRMNRGSSSSRGFRSSGSRGMRGGRRR